METEIKFEVTFFMNGSIKKEHVLEWISYYTGERSDLSGNNPLSEIEMRDLADMDEFLYKVKVS